MAVSLQEQVVLISMNNSVKDTAILKKQMYFKSKKINT